MFKVDNQYKNANSPRTVRFTEKLYNELSEKAYKNGVSFNLLVLQCCKYALENSNPQENCEPSPWGNE